MSSSVPSHATPEMLKWAREQEGMSVADVALAEGISAAQLEAWERGDAMPTFFTVKSLAKRYHRPVHFFYIPGPNQAFSFRRIRDFRTLPADVDRSFSTALRLAIRLAQERQAWISSYLEDEGVGRAGFIGALKSDLDVEEAASTVRSTLGVVPLGQRVAQDVNRAFVFWRRALESVGVYVFQAQGVSISEMRGCSLADPYAPAVLINSKEDYGPRNFTIIHELVHVMLGESSISGSGDRPMAIAPNRKIERFCNRVAAEVLVPMDDFLSQVPGDWSSHLQTVLTRLANRYWVSQSVIVLRLLEARLASRDFVEDWMSGIGHKKKRKSGPIPQERIAVGRFGELFAQQVVSAFHGRRIHAGEVAGLLRMKLQHLPKLEQLVYPNVVHPFQGDDVA